MSFITIGRGARSENQILCGGYDRPSIPTNETTIPTIPKAGDDCPTGQGKCPSHDTKEKGAACAHGKVGGACHEKMVRICFFRSRDHCVWFSFLVCFSGSNVQVRSVRAYTRSISRCLRGSEGTASDVSQRTITAHFEWWTCRLLSQNCLFILLLQEQQEMWARINAHIKQVTHQAII